MMQEVNLSPVHAPARTDRAGGALLPHALRRRCSDQAPVAREDRRSPLRQALRRTEAPGAVRAWPSAGRPELLFLDEPTVGLDVQCARRAVAGGARPGPRGLLDRPDHALPRRSRGAGRSRRGARRTASWWPAAPSTRSARYVSRKNILCRSSAGTRRPSAPGPKSQQLRENAGRLQIATRDAEAVLRRLLAADAKVRDIEVRARRPRRSVRRDHQRQWRPPGKLQ